MPEIILKAGREKPLLRRHPWVYSGAINSVRGTTKIGETVDILDSTGNFLARAAYNPNSQLSARVWTWDVDEQVDGLFFEERLSQSIRRRKEIEGLIPSNAMRLVNGESDGLPGLILDRYDDVYVTQFLTAGVEYWKDILVHGIQKCSGARILYERSDVDVRQLEGLEGRSGNLIGEINHPVEIIEGELKYLVDIKEGHKTGFYLDQRDNRIFVRSISENRKVLDCFSYTGGFAINCLAANADKVTLVESSNLALDYAQRNLALNKISLEQVELIEQDVFKYMRTLRDKSESYDMVILDPPKFAPTAAQVDKAARAYKDINLLAFKLLNKGGYLLTFSCSGGVSEELFQKIVAGAALDAGVDAVIIKRLHQAADHPMALNFPEAAYLKGFLIQKIS